MNTTVNTAQLNVRMDAACKKAGDAALASIGYSPSDAVRALWSTAARRGADLQEVKNLIDGHPKKAPPDKLEALEAGRRRVLAYFENAGIAVPEATSESASDEEAPQSMSDKEAYAEALLERLEERGLA